MIIWSDKRNILVNNWEKQNTQLFLNSLNKIIDS